MKEKARSPHGFAFVKRKRKVFVLEMERSGRLDSKQSEVRTHRLGRCLSVWHMSTKTKNKQTKNNKNNNKRKKERKKEGEKKKRKKKRRKKQQNKQTNKQT